MTADRHSAGDGDRTLVADKPLGADVVSALVHAAPDGMVMVDEGGLILSANRRAEDLFGYGHGDLLGRQVEVLLPDGLRLSNGERFDHAEWAFGQPHGLQLRGRRLDGANFPVEISLSPLRTQVGVRILAAMRDVTARVAAENEAREVRRLLDATRDAVLMFEPDTLLFTYVNDGAVAQLGYSREEFFSMTPLQIKPTFTETEFRALIDGLTPGQSHSYTTVHRRRDGTDIQVEAVLQHPAGDHLGSSGWIVSIARDLTARLDIERRAKAAEKDVAVLEDRQRIARDLHDRVIQRLFAAGLGIEALRGRVDDPLLADRLERVVGELDDTIRELRSSIFELNFAPQAQSLRAMVFEVCSAERAALGFDPVLHFEGPVDAREGRLGDDLVAVLREALSNVARHAGATSVVVTLLVGASLALRVEDNGHGASPDASGCGKGLANMTARAERLGGTCALRPAGPLGTVLEWSVPLGSHCAQPDVVPSPFR